MAGVRSELKSEIAEVRTDLKADLAHLKGMVSQIPTVLQLGGFVLAIFLAAGIMRYFFGA